jgi:hypothetical protein
MLLAIDPGKVSGFAFFSSDKRLMACGLGDPSTYRWHVPSAFSKVVIEQPRIYPGGRTKNPNDVLSVAVNAGEWGGRYSFQGCEVQYVTPSGWKGQTKKEIQHARDWARLGEDEQEVVSRSLKGVPASKRHNALDAVGIGLWAVGR